MANFQRFLSSTFKELKPDSWDKLIKAIDNRFNLLEESQDAQEKVASDILKRGLQVIEDGIGPSVIAAREAVEQIDDMTSFMTAHSSSEVAISAGLIELTIDLADRAYFVAPKFIVAYVQGHLDKWMTGQVQSWDKETGKLIVNITHLRGDGPFSDWTIVPTTIPETGPTIDSYTKTEVNSVIAQAKSEAITETKNDLLGGVGEAYDTLKELADARGDNVDAITALTTLVDQKEDKSALSDLAYLDFIGHKQFSAARTTGLENHTTNGHLGVNVISANDGIATLGGTPSLGGQNIIISKTGYYFLRMKHYAMPSPVNNRLYLQVNNTQIVLMTHIGPSTLETTLESSAVFHLNDGDWLNYAVDAGGWPAICYHAFFHTEIFGAYLG